MSQDLLEERFYKARKIYDAYVERQNAIEEKISKLEAELEILRDDLSKNDDAIRRSEEAYFEALNTLEAANRRARKDFTDIGLQTRAKNALMRAGVRSVDDLAGMTFKQIKKIRNIGKLTFSEIGEKLVAHGISPKWLEEVEEIS